MLSFGQSTALSVMVVAPLSGWLADWWHMRHIFLGSALGFMMGLTFVSLTFTIVGITILFISSAINQTLAAGVALEGSQHTKLNTLSSLTTWRDLGTALGAFAGVYLVELSNPTFVFIGLTFLVSGFTLKYASRKTMHQRLDSVG